MITSNFLLHSAVQRYGYYFIYCSIFLDIFHSIMVLLLGSSIPCYWRTSRLIVFCAFRDNNSKLKEVGTESKCLFLKSPSCRLFVFCFHCCLWKFNQRKKKERKTKWNRVPFFNLTNELGCLKSWFKKKPIFRTIKFFLVARLSTNGFRILVSYVTQLTKTH